ncbi:hypothetical protein [Hymenobacter fodinae]|uniref:Uncharacterized protein n=1 Tax=Hymenobacter fodinae TaxID=2510796 RepID=A0A4Z0P5E9_9BACT|nr:hypothetical protein [Hymenobacter fodinae]TGE05606.1 hypothetical protein EU556_20100 [Hymenobacter fodinae]
MTIAPSTIKPRINPVELRYLRQSVAACAVGCRYQAMQAIVVYAKLHDNMDLTDEAAYLEAEFKAAEENETQLHISAASL